METIQVLLVGGRQTPNVIGILLLRPSRIDLVVSKDEVEKASILLESLKDIENLELPPKDDIIVVDAYDFQSNIKAFRHICDKYKGDEVQFNLTGSTKIMAIAAYETARREGMESFYINTAGNEILWLNGRQDSVQQTFELMIEDYLSIFGRKVVQKFKFENLSFNKQQAIDAAILLGKSSPRSASMLQKIRRHQIKGSIGLKVSLSDFDEYEKALIYALKDINALDLKDDMVILRSNNDFEFFKGDWLEVYIYYEAFTKKNKKGNPIFNDCDLSIRILSGPSEKEIDVACISEAQLIHCSCKTDKDPFKTQFLDEMHSVSNLIGGRFCSRIFITNAVFSDYSKQLQFLDQAKHREIVVVTGNDLENIGEILAKQAITPNFRRV